MALNDIERKVLRIIANFSAGRRRMPTVHELCVKTGRTPGGIMKVLFALNQEHFIEWSRECPNKIILLQAWEVTNSYVGKRKPHYSQPDYI